MERLVGANLSEHLKANGGKLDARAVADIVVQACEALAHAHAAGIVHRDVKPSNLFVHDCPGRSPTGDDKGRSVVKVLDFGISKQLSREEWEKTLTEGAEGGVLGSPPYMAPGARARSEKRGFARRHLGAWRLDAQAFDREIAV